MSDWNAEQYLKFKKDRTKPSIDLSNKIDIENPKNIIDIGCGPANSTAVLKNKFPNAYVLGVDSSENMINTAKKSYPDIDFMLFDAAKDFERLDKKFDVVFSNACIQWVPDHHKLIPNMMSILRDGGMLAVQIPITVEQDMHRVKDTVLSKPYWNDRLSGARTVYTLNDYEYFDILSGCSSDFEIWKTVYYHRLPSHQSVLEWYRSTGLKPYFDKLNDDDKALFEQDILEEIAKHFPVRQNGEIIFKFPRLFFTAKK